MNRDGVIAMTLIISVAILLNALPHYIYLGITYDPGLLASTTFLIVFLAGYFLLGTQSARSR